jgi:signal transduction histidine kinase
LRLLKLVNDILDMDKLISGTAVFRSDPVDLLDMVAQSIEANVAYGASFQVSYQIADKVDHCTVAGDLDRIMQVMANLLSNAAKFSRPGSVVKIHTSQLDDLARIEVEDTGQGIPDDFQSRIFSPFSQASNGDTRKQGGTGLGLNISKKLVENMGGEIGYVSTKGVGTIFWFTLPVYRK